MPFIKIENLCFNYGKTEVIRGISLKIGSSNWILVIGPNGAGKSTLLKLIIGFLSPSRGKVEIDGMMVSLLTDKDRAKLLGYLPQTVLWTFPFSVYEIVSMGMFHKARGLRISTNAQSRQKISEIMSFMGLEGFAMRKIDELSAGERQLVYLARVLVQDPQFFLLDEPTANLDMNHKKQFWETIRQLKSQGKGGIVVSHEVQLPDGLFDYIVGLKSGKILMSGEPSYIMQTQKLELLYETPMKVIHNGMYLAFPSL